MKELLLSNSFKLVSNCSCGGTYRETYAKNRSASIQIEIMPIKKTFRLIINGKREKVLSETLFEQTMKEYELI